MLATVSAGVPVEVRNQVHQKLRNSRTTPPQFINDVCSSCLSDNLSLKKKLQKRVAAEFKNWVSLPSHSSKHRLRLFWMGWRF